MNTATRSSRVSIILPTFNRAEYILETIESILKQTHTNWELIIVDDGSTDNTGELVARLNDERIRFHEAGRIGVNGKIKNIGIGLATGEFIAFIDSDDLWASGKLEKQVTILNEYPDAGFTLTGGYNFRKINEPVEFFYRQQEGFMYGNGFIPFFKSQVAAFTQSLLLRKNCIATTGFFNETKQFADPEFILSLAWHFKMIILYEPLLYRRLHANNHSSQEWVKNYKQTVELIQSYREKGMLPNTIARDALFRMYVNYGEDCLRHQKRVKAFSVFFQAWRNKPLSVVGIKKMGKAVVG
jgi:glycosyltransferase involved in cell wall biosynthesis